MDRATARRVLGVPVGADRRAVEAAFRWRARSVASDVGGDGSRLDRLVRARDVLLAPPAPRTAPPEAGADPSPWDEVRAALRPRRRRAPRPRRVI